MLTKSRAIVLHSMKFGESQLIVDLLTEVHGRLSFICHVSKSPKGKIKKQFFQPLSLLELEYDFRVKAKLQHLKDIRIAVPFGSIPFDPFKLSISLFIADFLYYASRSEQENPLLYQYVEHSILWLDNTLEHFSSFHLVFMMRLSRFLGFYPNVEEYQEDDYFDLREGRFVSLPPGHPDFVSGGEAKSIRLLMRLTYENMHLCPMSRMERNRCAEVIILYYRFHIPNFPELKSFDILQELFA